VYNLNNFSNPPKISVKSVGIWNLFKEKVMIYLYCKRRDTIMREQIQQLKPSNITSEVFIIAPTQIDYIAQIFGNGVADAMNMRTFAPKIRQIAKQALQSALAAARHQGEK